ncbi:MAG: TolC family protein [Gemmatimonadaceae bacterium]|nr:TolC family protein [Gemmatimonadaceae bacterium]
MPSPTGAAAPSRLHRTLVLCLAAGAAIPSLRAQSPTLPRDTLTLPALQQLAATRDPRVRAAAALATAATARIGTATRPPDPELQLGAMNVSLPGLRADPVLGMTQLQLMQMVPLPGKLGAAATAARARATGAEARSREVVLTVRADAAVAYLDRWEAVESARLAGESRRLLEDAASVATAMYRVGDGRQSDVLRARVEIARMDEEVVRMTAMADAAAARLAAALDTTPETLLVATAPPTLPDSLPALPTLLALAADARPMLAAGTAGVRAAVADADLARRELWPDLRVGVQYGQRRMEGATDRMGSLMLGTTLPVFARARQLRMREEAAAMRAMADADLAAMRAETRRRVAEVHAMLASARRLRALYRTTVLPQADAAAASALASYRSGAVDFMTVLDNRMTATRYRRELVALDASEGRAWAELEMLTDRPWLTSPALPAGAPR